MRRQRFSSPKLDLLFAVVLFAIQQGWAMSGLHPNIIIACVIWGLALALLLHAFWVWEITAQLRKWVKLTVTIAIPALIALAIWPQVVDEYRKEHAPPERAQIHLEQPTFHEKTKF